MTKNSPRKTAKRSVKQSQVILLAAIASILLWIIGCSRAERTSPYYVMYSSNWENTTLQGIKDRLYGFCDDLFLEIEHLEEIRIRVNGTQASNVLSLLERHSVDAVIATLTPNRINEKIYRFSEPFYVSGPVLVVRSDSPYKTINDIEFKDVAFERGYPWAIELENYDTIQFHPYDNESQALESLLQKKVDAIVIDSIKAYMLAQSYYKNSIRIIPSPLKMTALRLIVKRGKSEEFIDYFNNGLEKMKSSGLYLKMVEYWGLYDISEPVPEKP